MDIVLFPVQKVPPDSLPVSHIDKIIYREIW